MLARVQIDNPWRCAVIIAKLNDKIAAVRRVC